MYLFHVFPLPVRPSRVCTLAATCCSRSPASMANGSVQQAVRPGCIRTDVELRGEALNEWAVFTVHGTEGFDLNTFKRFVSHVASLFSPTHSVLSLSTWVHCVALKSQMEVSRNSRQRKVTALYLL